MPIKGRYNQCINSIAFKYLDNQCPHYLNEVFMKAPESSSSLRNSYQKLQQPFPKTNTGQNALSFIGPALWNKVPKEIKRTILNLNAIKHNFKELYLKELAKATFLEKLLSLISLVWLYFYIVTNITIIIIVAIIILLFIFIIVNTTTVCFIIIIIIIIITVITIIIYSFINGNFFFILI